MKGKKLGDYTVQEFKELIENAEENQQILENIKKIFSKTNQQAGVQMAVFDAILRMTSEYTMKARFKICTEKMGIQSNDQSGEMTLAKDYFGMQAFNKDEFKEKKKISEEDSLEEIFEKLIEYSDELKGKKNGTKSLKDKKKEGKLDAIQEAFNLTGMIEKKQEIEKIKDLIENGATQIILTGAPGTGKTRMAKEIAEGQEAELTWEEKKDDSYSYYKLVQFHPSYDYTDFVEGLRPVEEEGKMVFCKVDGIFKEFCRKVVEEGKEDKKYFFLIDEINRADLSKVFGELMFCLETDKRGEDNAIQTQYQNLPTYDTKEKKYYGEDESEDVFKDGFYIPKNVIIIGTMNDIDRSVESMDFALRRRFIWKEIVVNKAMLEASLTDIIKIENPEGVAAELAKRINDLNENQLKEKLGKHYYISQGQFANLPKNIIDDAVKAGNAAGENKVEAIAKSLLEAVWDLRLNSLLYEYIRGEGNEENFVKSCHEALLAPSRSKEQPEENSQS